MDSTSKNAGAVTPLKNPQANRSKTSENTNPNITSPSSRLSKSPAIKSAKKTQKSAAKNPNHPSPRNKIRERKFVVAKRNSKKEKENSSTVLCKCKDKGFGTSHKCLCVAYDSLRASQEEFFKNRGSAIADYGVEETNSVSPTLEVPNRYGEVEEEMNSVSQTLEIPNGYGEIEEEMNSVSQTLEIANGCEGKSEESDDLGMNGVNESDPNETTQPGEMGSSKMKRTRDKLLEEARQSVPEAGFGKVMHLVKAFEKLLTIPKEPDESDERESEDDDKKVLKWALPGLQPRAPETRSSSSSFCPSDFFVTSESLGLDACVSSSLDSNHGSFTISSRTSAGGRRSRRKSSESSGNFGGSRWKKRQLKATSQMPFKLRTEQRGRSKEEEFVKKIQQMMMEEEKQRIPIAQGLPWTTDEPEYLVKPPVKEITRPIDLVLHSDVRAVERAEFDQQIAEKMCLIEQFREERERQQKLAEEEEIKRLRKEQVPRAQPMPYFDRPFIPRRSERHPTIPRDPRFHIPQHKKIKCCLSSWNDMYDELQH
ncbi:hypothetical protein RHGRI_028516 [Rhododendron griersonianum]|uniref:TPX2 C-terminal domain-containing protein n=1 Tax=Rhododendron griersonianum TaxID=479676 RepID=A0AAV6IJX7_9ERIC|nr:hypothetical protein RHGRI_028516 [Rhododendron griersonianum]